MMAAGLASLEGMIEGKIVALCDLESACMESVNVLSALFDDKTIFPPLFFNPEGHGAIRVC